MQIKHLARTTNRNPGDIVTEVLNAMDRDALVTMTSVETLKRQIRDIRHREGGHHGPIPQHKNGWEVPADLQTFVEDGGRFLQWDSGQDDPDRILMFASDEMIRNLHATDHFFSDGVMSKKPRMFHQLYSIHGKMVRHSSASVLTSF